MAGKSSDSLTGLTWETWKVGCTLRDVGSPPPSQMDLRYVDHPVHLERTNEPVSQLAEFHTEREVLG